MRDLDILLKAVVDSYKTKPLCRTLLESVCQEVGLLPEVQRMTCDFTDLSKYPARPTVSLFEGAFSIWLLGWREGDKTEVHDHGPDREVGIYVLTGAVTEDIFITAPSMPGGDRGCLASFSRQLKEGDMVTCTRNYIHRMSNIAPCLAATLHVYGPTLEDMCLYEDQGNVLKWKEHWHESHEVAPH